MKSAIPGSTRLRMLAALPLVVIPPAVNLTDGLRPMWTHALPSAVIHVLARAWLLDLELIFDILAASGVLGVLAIVIAAGGARRLAAALLALIALMSLAVSLTPAPISAFWYGIAYLPAAALVSPSTAKLAGRAVPRKRERPTRVRRIEGDSQPQEDDQT